MANDQEPKLEGDLKQFYKRKLDHILRDREYALATIQRLGERTLSNKGWSITVVLAYIGYITTSYDNPNDIPWLVLLPLYLTILLFWGMEGFYRGQSIYFRRTVIHTIDHMFSEKEDAPFWDAVKAYKFLSDPKNPKTPSDKWGRLVKGCLAPEAISWYVPIMLLSLVWRLCAGFCGCGGSVISQ